MIYTICGDRRVLDAGVRHEKMSDGVGTPDEISRSGVRCDDGFEYSMGAYMHMTDKLGWRRPKRYCDSP
jgi:hypothetical protein